VGWAEHNVTPKLNFNTQFLDRSGICRRQETITALPIPILTEVVEEVAVSDTSESSDKHVCSSLCEPETAGRSASILLVGKQRAK